VRDYTGDRVAIVPTQPRKDDGVRPKIPGDPVVPEIAIRRIRGTGIIINDDRGASAVDVQIGIEPPVPVELIRYLGLKVRECALKLRVAEHAGNVVETDVPTTH